MNEFFLSLKDAFLNSTVTALTVIFVENAIFTRALGVSTAFSIVKKKGNLLPFGLVLTWITLASSFLSFSFEPFISKLPSAYYFRPLLYVLMIGVVYILTLSLCRALSKRFYPTLRPMIHLSAFNGAVFGSMYLCNLSRYRLLDIVPFSLGIGIGFMLAVYLLSLGYDHLNSDKISPSFRGFPIMLIYTGFLSLAFYGLIGHELVF